MTRSPDKPQSDTLAEFLTNNNPAKFYPKTIDEIFHATFEKRKEAAIGPSYSQVLNSVNEGICNQMAKDFAQLGTRVIAEWSLTQPEFKNEKEGKRLSSVYHRGPHGAEMGKDAELLLAKQAEKLFTNEAQRTLYIQMAKVAHAIHDVIQDRGPPLNEIESAKVYTRACNEIIDNYKDSMTKEQLEQLKKVSDNFGWEAIVVGTTFDFAQKRPVVDIINEATKKFGNEAVPPHVDPAVACVAFACGKNDTRRMEVTLDSYTQDPNLNRLLDLQLAATGGDNNIFMKFLNNREVATNEAQMMAARHMIGQNCRMICELKTHFGNGGDDLDFARFLTNLISDASTKFDSTQHQDLKENFNDINVDAYFEKFINSFKGNFGETAFAKGLNEAVFENAVNNFNDLYPEHNFDLSGKGTLWSNYGKEADAFITHIEEQIKEIKNDSTLNAVQKEARLREYKTTVMTDLALYGGHQMGSALMRENKDMLEAYQHVIKDTTSKLNSLNIKMDSSLSTDIIGLQGYLHELRMKRDEPHEEKENVTPRYNNSLSFSKPSKAGNTPEKYEQAIKLCEGLINASKEKTRIERQILNLDNSNTKQFAPPKDIPEKPRKAIGNSAG